MSKTTISASATGLPSRRLFLATAPVVALAASMRHVVAGEKTLARLIERHRAAHKAFNEICGFEDRVKPNDPRYSALCAEHARLDEAEEIALTDLCSYRPKTMREVRERGDYLAAFAQRNQFTSDQETSLLLSHAN
jgi:hypothetical protein